MNDIYVAVALLGVSIIAVLWIAFKRPSLPDTEPQPRRHPCHICRRAGYYTVRRRDTNRLEWTCVGCHDQGTAWGWWADTEIEDRNAS